MTGAQSDVVKSSEILLHKHTVSSNRADAAVWPFMEPMPISFSVISYDDDTPRTKTSSCAVELMLVDSFTAKEKWNKFTATDCKTNDTQPSSHQRCIKMSLALER